MVNAGAVVVRAVSALPCSVVLVAVLVGVVVLGEEGVVAVVAVLWVVVPDGVALDTDTVFVPPEPQPLNAKRLAARLASSI